MRTGAKAYTHVKVFPLEVKIADEGERIAVIDFATTDLDRVGDVFHPEGIANLDEFRSNPIIGFNHFRSHDLPIGKALEVTAAKDRLRAKVQFDDDEFSLTVYRKVKGGSLRTGSIGYTPLEEKFRDGANHILKSLLFECSVVTIPANPKAQVQLAKSLGLLSDDDDDPLDALLGKARRETSDPLATLLRKDCAPDPLALLLRKASTADPLRELLMKKRETRGRKWSGPPDWSSFIFGVPSASSLK